ncbi:protein-methionine sulfoxide oxidase mical2b isoform X4 [Oncorhynchus kisutch]|uniref:protein-methionine sulfoxide oxidase mical2b isoform X4 n=1 Tax=Oncorhynchus kisutch TaxID=8019 RepID=UPI0012DD6BB3|nr:protein-methionine sulfoxide oxidase mical2b-like isoform X4 [Oncorhynchus kisutch]
MGEKEDERSAQAGQLFENFVQASTCKGTLQAFSILCRQMDLDPLDYRNFYSNLKATVTNWKAKALWTKLDKRAGHKEYKKAKACEGTRSLIIGGGPCGLRTAIELALLGAKVVVIEKRDTFSRNNVLHLWPYTIHDLRGLGAKKFYGKFCAGAIDHISIRQLQLMLLKVSLIVGVEVHVNVEFVKLLEPLDNQENEGLGWRAEIRPSNHPLTDYEFDVVIGADGRRNTLDGFKRKEFRGKLAIAITANFVNRNTTAEAKVEEISGVAFIFNQKFFLELKEETGIDLENIVYYRDNTHYFVMTAKKQSLLDKGVIIHDYIETEKLLGQDNVNQEALLSYAREAADFGTNYQLPSLDYAINHCNQPDVAMFDFTCMCASENAALFREKCGHQLLVALVGDSLLEPFWPTGTGCARGFLAAFDTVWMVRGWAQGKTHLEILAEREGLYRLLPQTTTENISKNFDQYTIDPVTRYPNLNSSCVKPHQVRHLFIDGQQDSCPLERGGSTRSSVNLSRRESDIRPSRLLTWCQKQTQGYRGVDVTNLTSSWKSGLALCALIHRLRPDLIDFDSLNEKDSAKNNQLAFDIAEHEFGIQPVTTGNEMALDQDPDKLMMVLYISKLYEMFRNSPASITGTRETDENNEVNSSESAHSVYNLMNRTQPKKRIPKVPWAHPLVLLLTHLQALKGKHCNNKGIHDNGKLEANDPMNKRRRKGSTYLEELSCQSAPPAGDGGEQNKVRSMATQLLAKFEENASPGSSLRNKSDLNSDSDSSRPSSPSLDMMENPRFAKPKKQPPPSPPPPRPKWQPSIYIRLLEEPAAAAQPTPLHVPTRSWSPPPRDDQTQASPRADLVQQRVWIPHTETPDDVDYPEQPSPGPTGKGVEKLEQKMSQKKVQTVTTGEFNRKSIKERAVLLRSMFPESETPLVKEYKTDRSAFVPKITSIHPVPESSALSCVSSLTPTSPVHHYKCDGSAASSRLIQTPIECPVSYQAEPFKPDMSAEQCNGSAAPSVMIKKTIDQSEHCPAEPSMPAKQRTVGRVSSHIGARAETLAILYETDHRPNALPCIVRKEFPQNLGGSDTCHFCSKRVYVMERLSAEGHFFHRECFRCDVCSSTLRLGGHAYDSQHGKFYCKPHYSQRRPSLQSSSKFLRRTEDQGRLTSSPDRSDPYSATDSLQSQPSGHHYRYTGLLNGQYTRMVPEVAEEEAVDLDMPDSNRTADSEKQDNSNTSLRPQDSAQEKKEPSGSNSSLLSGNSRWKRKIRATLPLILVRHFSHENATEKEEPIIEEANVIEPPQVSHDGPKLPPDSPNQNPSMGKEAPPVTKVPQLEEAVGPKKRLTLSLSEKQKLLDWNLVTPEEAQSPGGGDPSKHSKPGDQILPLPQVEAEPVPAQAQPAPSMFQIWANAFRRSFGVLGTTTDSNTVVTRRNNNGPTKPRPLTDGAFSFSSLFGATAQSQEAEPVGVGQKSQPTPHPCKASMGDRPADLPMLLDQVSLGSSKSVGSFTTDDMASLPPRKLNFFSYPRLKKREGPESVGAGVLEKDIRTILSNIRNKASSEQQKDESNSSSDDELVIAKPLSQPKTHGSSERQRRRQEETVIQQDKREQLKRLHRAQVIQRQLEEVGEKQKDLEERGVTIEKVLRGESPDKGDGLSDEHELLQMWFKLVLEKNRLARYEEELVIFAQELELEDRQSQLQRDLRCRMSIEDSKKSPSELAEEQEMLTEIMKVVERRDTLVSLLEEQRLQERAEDRDPESLVLSRGYQFHWT